MKSPNLKKLVYPLCTGITLAVMQLGISGAALAAGCPAVTVADAKGVLAGQFPQQYELAEFQTLAKCTLSFKANPDIAALNKKIYGNPELPPLAERLPEEPPGSRTVRCDWKIRRHLRYAVKCDRIRHIRHDGGASRQPGALFRRS